MNHPFAKPKIFFRALKIAALSVFLMFFIFTPTKISYAFTDPAGAMSAPAGAMSAGTAPSAINVKDQEAINYISGVKKVTQKLTLERAWSQVKTWAKETLWQQLKKSGDIAWRQSLKYFLDTLAYDMATYIATGDKGQLPMFETQGWGGYLKDVADNTAGTFIEQLGANMTTLKFNLCRPNLRVLLRINFGLMYTYRPPKPDCTITEMLNNWDQAMKKENFLQSFQGIFNPYSNDLGVALTLHSGISSYVDDKVNEAIMTRTEGQGFKAVTSPISRIIRTPSRVVMEAAGQPIRDSTASEKLYTGTILADSIDIFINTLIGKLIERWLTSGLIVDMPVFNNKLDSLANFMGQNQPEGIAGAKERMRTLVEPNFKVRADYDILAELASCPDPNKAGPTNCVIDEKFRQAIEKRLTVGEALSQGYLNGNGVFGFTSDGLEPNFNEGYPYRSMIILRKYRIIPVGWEAAAQKIKDLQGQGDKQVNGTKNLKDLVDCGRAGAPAWCAGLVDPDWVLKAPQNFCKREGAGPEIISEQITGQGADSSRSILRNDTYCADEQSCIKEKSDGSCQLYGYCAEERRKWDFNAASCEPRHNTCQTFSSPDGQAVSYLENTLDFSNCNLSNAGCLGYCQNYNWAGAKFSCGAGAGGDKVYLNQQAETCDQASEGCRQLIRLNPGGGANLLINSGFEQGLALGGWGFGGLITDPDLVYQGVNSLEARGAFKKEIRVGGDDYNIAGESYVLSFYAKNCAANFWIGDTSNILNINLGADWARYNLAYAYPAGVITNTVKFGINSTSCLIDNIKLERGAAATAYSDYAAASSRSLVYEKLLPDYLASGNNSLNDGIQGACYEFKDGSYQLKDNAPDQCLNFARRCSQAEAGCELYTSQINETKIPAKVVAADYCPAECVGYNEFVQSATNFSNKQAAYFIPKTAKTCSAQAAGCDQFTNLDEKAQGGEKAEYYSYLRQCLKKSDNESSCGDFYTWEGSDESGYQLKTESLKKEGNSPAVTESDSDAPCDESVYNLLPGQPGYNADCRQFYNTKGEPFYRLYSRTISCTDDCHPYRRTETNELTAADYCLASCSSGVDAAAAACRRSCNTNNLFNCSTVKYADKLNSCKLDNDRVILCKNGGTWSSENNACIYMAVPNQGVTCAAAQNRCREYIGNTGNDVRNIFTDDFSGGTTGAWAGAGGSIVSPANESITLSADNRGHSIKVAPSSGRSALAQRHVGNAVSAGLSYVLNFVAKADRVATDLTISLGNGAVASTFAAPVKLTSHWQIFEINLAELGHEANASEVLTLAADQGFYINNITLREIVDRYYLIKDSWRTPLSCDQDLDHNPSSLYMLGCSQYQDRAGKTHNLKQFNKLCPETAVGCELMIDTKNSANPLASYYLNGQAAGSSFSASGGEDRLTAPADSFIYAVYDPDKLCGAEEKGCQYLGQPYTYNGAALYSDVYLKNNPDKYGQILCGANAVGCQSYSYDGGDKYFKDPGDQVCEWRQQTGQGLDQGWGWFKKKVKKCDDANSNGKIDGSETRVCLKLTDCDQIIDTSDNRPRACTKDADCRTGRDTSNTCLNNKCYYNCLKETTDLDCPASQDKTFGFGGPGNSVYQPDKDNQTYWAGICPAVDSGCAEYIDPLSQYNTNIIFNGDFQQVASSSTDGWTSKNINTPPYYQSIILDPNAVYRLARNQAAGQLTISDCAVPCVPAPGVTCRSGRMGAKLQELTSSNALGNPVDSIAVSQQTGYDNSKIFYYQGKEKASCKITVSSGKPGDAVELKKAIIDYQLKQNLDRQSCNGIVDIGKGCVLFNERKPAGQDNNRLTGLSWDADRTVNSSGPFTGANIDHDSNIILKVAPDRTCDKWLACKSYIKDAKGDNVCFDLGLCDAVDGNGNCQSFLSSSKNNQLVDDLGDKISNLSGYTKVGIAGGSLRTDYYPFGAMPQAGEMAEVSNGGFEYYGSNFYPVGWNWSGQAEANKSWDANIFSVINNPIAAQTEGTGNAPEGNSFLKLGSSYAAESEPIDVMPNTLYIITAYVNTINLKSGQAKIDIYNAAKGLIGAVITQDLGRGWQFQIGKFNTGDLASTIYVKLYAALADNNAALASSEGNFYFDDIKIRPALNSRDNLDTSPKSDWYAPQSCRLYSQTDSLACDYYDDSSARQKGWPGYCLEYDRRPGDPNVCLLWYPVDKVKGDGLEEGAGYAGRMPLYYCTSGQANRIYEYRHIFPIVIQGSENAPACPENYSSVRVACHGEDGGNDPSNWFCLPNKDKAIVLDKSIDDFSVFEGGCSGTRFGNEILTQYKSSADGWYDYDGSLNDFTSWGVAIFKSNPYAEYLCSGGETQGIIPCPASAGTLPSGETCNCVLSKEIYRSNMYCANVIQTVTATGQNKYWSGRVYEGSDYHLPVLNLGYSTDVKPFGAALPPNPQGNPYEWDSVKDNPSKLETVGNQPLYEKPADSESVRAGVVFKCLEALGETNNCKYIIDEAGPFPYNYYSKSNAVLNSKDLAKRLFAKSYGQWTWNHDTSAITTGRYLPSFSANSEWGPPGTKPGEPNNGLCENYNDRGIGKVRQDYPKDYCAIPPTVTNIKVNGSNDNVVLTNSQFVKLSFNSQVDSNQLPLVRYGVDWGDNSKTVVTGVEMRDKPDPAPNNPANDGSPEAIYHLYSYWDLKAKASTNQPSADGGNTVYCGEAGMEAMNYGNNGSGYVCGDKACCAVKPKIQIKDNWGWCNRGERINVCGAGQWDNFRSCHGGGNNGQWCNSNSDCGGPCIENWVVVKEK